VVVLLLPSTEEGFKNNKNANDKTNDNKNDKTKNMNPIPHHVNPASQLNSSRTAGSADGSSDHQHLLDNLLQKHDRLAEAFENRDNANKTTANAVSATTTKKKGIASSANDANDEEGGNVNPPVEGCNKKCVKIGDPMMALGGNCINPPRAGGAPNELDYSIKFCPAFQPPNDLREQDCMTCGYYKFTSECKSDPNNPKKPCDYENYKYAEYQPGPMPGTVDKGDNGGGDGPSCSTCKLQINPNTNCALPGCYSADGYLPFPDDGGYNFAEGCFYYNPDSSKPGKILPGMEGRQPGYYCPSITKGGSYDGGGTSGDVCYTKQDPNDPSSYTLDYSRFVLMDTVCSNDKQKSQQNFNPGKDAPVDDNLYPSKHRRQTASKTSATASTIAQQHQHSGAINVYHHYMSSSGTNNNNNNKQSGNNNTKQTSKNTYMEPEAGATVLGFL
jgi:hypothetical protein